MGKRQNGGFTFALLAHWHLQQSTWEGKCQPQLQWRLQCDLRCQLQGQLALGQEVA